MAKNFWSFVFPKNRPYRNSDGQKSNKNKLYFQNPKLSRNCYQNYQNNQKFQHLSNFLPKMANFWSFGKCQKCTGIFGPKFLVLTVKFRKNTLEFENLNGTQCLSRQAASKASPENQEIKSSYSTN